MRVKKLVLISFVCLAINAPFIYSFQPPDWLLGEWVTDNGVSRIVFTRTTILMKLLIANEVKEVDLAKENRLVYLSEKTNNDKYQIFFQSKYKDTPVTYTYIKLSQTNMGHIIFIVDKPIAPEIIYRKYGGNK